MDYWQETVELSGDTMSTSKHAVPEELLAGLLADYKKPEDLIGENGLLKQLTKLLVEKALDAELAEHLGHGKNEPVANDAGDLPPVAVPIIRQEVRLQG
jgi:putative transposase